MPTRIFKKSRGFTLIELMLVVLVTALIMLYVVRMVNQTLINQQVSRSVNQIQAIKQALITYYVRSGSTSWPNSLNDLVSKYLPENALCSPFSSPTQVADCGYVAQYQRDNSTSKSYYIVKLILPSNDLARRLSGKISDAWAINNVLRVSIMPPSIVGSLPNHGWIVSAGIVTLTPNLARTIERNPDGSIHYNMGAGAHIVMPNCPTGFVGHIFLAPQQYNTGYSFDDKKLKSEYYYNYYDVELGSESVNQLASGTAPTDRYGNPPYAVRTHGYLQATTNYYEPDNAYYMTYCVPQYNWKVFWVSRSFAQDAQCSPEYNASGVPNTTSSWRDYIDKSLTGNNTDYCEDSPSNYNFTYTYDGSPYPSSSSWPIAVGSVNAN